MTRIISYMMMFYILPFCLQGQNVESLVKSDPVKVTGYVTGGIGYIDSNRPNTFVDPLNYNLNIGVNFKFFNNFNIPVSFAYSKQQTSFNRPAFNLYGLSPNYKWITVHAGYRSYRLSKYMINGTQVLGGGLELTPGNFRFLAFYGNLTHKFNTRTNAANIAGRDLEFYKRKALGGRIGYGTNKNFIDISAFSAKDDPLTGDFLYLDSTRNYAKENVCLGLHFGLNPIKNVTISANAVGSAITENVQSNDIDEDIPDFVSNIIQVNNSSRYAFAYDANIDLKIKRFGIGFTYEHVDPNYSTLGISYFISDIDNYTMRINTSLFKSRVTLNGQLGYQFNNTKEQLGTRTKRTIFNGSASIRPTKSLSFSVSYNNFNSADNQVTLGEVQDTVRLISDNQGISANGQYSFGNKEVRKSIGLNYSIYTFSIIRQEELLADNQSNTAQLRYTHNIKARGLSLSGGIIYSDFLSDIGRSINRKGVQLSGRKKINEKLTVSAGANFYSNQTNGESDGYVVTTNARTGYNLSDKQSLSFSLGYQGRKTTELEPFNQITTRLQYSLNLR